MGELSKRLYQDHDHNIGVNEPKLDRLVIKWRKKKSPEKEHCSKKEAERKRGNHRRAIATQLARRKRKPKHDQGKELRKNPRIKVKQTRNNH